MIEDREQALALLHEMEAQLPIPARATPDLGRMLEKRGARIDTQALRIKRVFYLGDEGGIMCDVTPPEGAGHGKPGEALVVSLTRLIVDPTHPLAQAITDYQAARKSAMAASRQWAQMTMARPAHPAERPRSRMVERPELAALPQARTTWQCTARRAPSWIEGADGAVFRPYIVLVMEVETDYILQSQMADERPTPEAVLGALGRAMREQISGPSHRPRTVLIDDPRLVAALTPPLEELGIKVEYRSALPLIDQALRHMAALTYGKEQFPGLLTIKGFTPELGGEFFSAASEFYRRATWKAIDSNLPIEIEYPANTEPHYTLVLGHESGVYGLSLYASPQEVQKLLSADRPARPEDEVTTVNVMFVEATLLPFEDLDAIERYGWPVAGSKAFPIVVKALPNEQFTRPNITEFILISAALRVIPDFAPRLTRAVEAAKGVIMPLEKSYVLPDAFPWRLVVLRSPMSLMGPTGELLRQVEYYVSEWYRDEGAHSLALNMGLFMFDFIASLSAEGLAPRTLDGYWRNCWAIGMVVCRYGKSEEATPAIFKGEPAFIQEFEAHVSRSSSAVEGYKRAWRRLGRYVRQSEEQGHGISASREAGAGRGGRIAGPLRAKR